MANVYPNSDAALFSTWLLTSGYQRFTPARVTVITAIQTAANAGTFVSQHEWNTFINITGIYYPAFQENINLTNVPMWTDYSSVSTIIGWSSFIRKNIWYLVIGKNLYVLVDIYGTSNSATTTITIPRPSSVLIPNDINIIRVGDNNVASSGLSALTANSNLVTFYKDVLGSAFTNSGAKYLEGTFIVPLD